MSTRLYEDRGIIVTEFFGGKDRGVCVEVSNVNVADHVLDSAQLTRVQAETVVTVLATWLGLTVERKVSRG